MPTNLTLEGIPNEVYQRLKASAALNKRSLEHEAIVCLDAALMAGHMPVTERLARVRALRASLKPVCLTTADIDKAKRSGRK